MKNLKKDLIITALVLISLFFLFGWIKSCRSDHTLIKEQSDALKGNPLSETIKKDTVTDKYGIQHMQMQNVPSQSLAATITQDYFRYANDTLAPVLKIKSQQIDELTRINAQLKEQIKATEVQRDSAGNLAYVYKTKYLTAVANTKDSTLKYIYNAIIDVANYSKKSWFVGASKQYVDVSSPDTSFRINGLQHYKKELNSDKPFFNLGIEANTIYHFTSLRNYELNLGLHAEFNPYGRFSPQINAGYNYNPNTDSKTFHPYIRAGVLWNIIRH